MTYRKLGMDRNQMGVGQAFGSGTGSLVTGDITRGEVVEVIITVANAGGSATVSPRRTGAIPIAIALDDTNEAWNWSITGTTLSVNWTAGSTDGVMHFWVF
jgi:hypothetical protein